jgi:hypothetical protein
VCVCVCVCVCVFWGGVSDHVNQLSRADKGSVSVGNVKTKKKMLLLLKFFYGHTLQF